MKKVIVLLLVVSSVFLVAGCNKDEEKEDVSIKVIAPIGAPALAQTNMESNLPVLGEHISYEIEVVSGTDPLVAAFGSESHNIIYAPTNLGAKLVSTGVPYKFAATVVWGNLYLATKNSEVSSLADLDGKDIVVFGQNATPDIVVQTVLNAQNYSVAPTITYVADALTAKATIVGDPNKIVLLAEPVLSVSMMAVSDLTTIDLQAEWNNITGDEGYPQAGIFVHSDLDEDAVRSYLTEVEKAVNEANTNPGDVAALAVELEYGFPLPVLTGAIPRSGLRYQDALDSKAALETYFGYILEMNGALIGGSLPEDSFYFD